MGKKVPLRIGRKSNRELNPMEKMRRKEKHKKNINQFIAKLNKKASGEFVTKVKHRRSPSPESNDPMLGELISTNSLRNPNSNIEVSSNESSVEEKVMEMPKSEPKNFVPLAVINKPRVIQQIEDSNSSGSEDDYSSFPISIAQPSHPAKISQNQNFYKTLLESDSKLTDFFSSISHLM